MGHNEGNMQPKTTDRQGFGRLEHSRRR
jgi:hypothetical protein